MDELLRDLAQPVWWINSLVFALLVNLAAAYLKDNLDRIGSRFSFWLRRRNAEKQRHFETEVIRLLGCPNEVMDLRHKSLHWDIWAAIYLALYMMVAFLYFGPLFPSMVSQSSQFLATLIGIIMSGSWLVMLRYCILRRNDVDGILEEVGRRMDGTGMVSGKP